MKDVTCRQEIYSLAKCHVYIKNLFAPATENCNRHEFSDVAMRNEPLLCLDVAVTSDSPLRTGKM